MLNIILIWNNNYHQTHINYLNRQVVWLIFLCCYIIIKFINRKHFHFLVIEYWSREDWFSNFRAEWDTKVSILDWRWYSKRGKSASVWPIRLESWTNSIVWMKEVVGWHILRCYADRRYVIKSEALSFM